ncbi:hypothetical protein TD95_000836 [Thielaviopsis punctulata]|uniref:Methyltransferase type 11 domain-containing protein n=1 Tax=Thielaviopsis punctulata TaxID=72032 RepID=A0A0F4ZJ76_9PEZI|nr:hypothetical protein TD95_000836 [Thielaviopsis punctulata]
MSIFGRSTFSAAGYAAARPSYPSSLYEHILRFHGTESQRKMLIDIGCGPGTATVAFSDYFDCVVGLDPSANMVQQASALHASKNSHMSFRIGSAEDLSFLPAGSVDVAVASQSAHWFDYGKAWPELARVLRHGGTLAFWGYNDNILVGHPAATAVFYDFLYRPDEDGDVAPGMHSMGRYWEQPGRSILRTKFADVALPAQDWVGEKRTLYQPDAKTCVVDKADAEKTPIWLEKHMSLGQFEAYARTFSSYRGWCDANPQFVARAQGGQGDIVDIMFDQMREVTPGWKAAGDKWREIEVDAVWGTVLVMAKRS